MSRIDKLVAKAFPDELRDVRPVETDEDALFTMTLEKLGLEPPAPAAPEKPKSPLSFLRRGKRQEKLVEVPLERVRSRWAGWLAGALAACLALGCGIYWGSWMMNSLGIGARPHSAGDVNSRLGAVAEAPSQPSPPDPDKQSCIEVTSSLAAVNRFTVSVTFRGLMASAYKAEARVGDSELYCVERSTEAGTGEEQVLNMTFVSEEDFEKMKDTRLVLRLQLIPGLLVEEDIDLQAYPESVGFVEDTRSGETRKLSGEELEEMWGEAG